MMTSHINKEPVQKVLTMIRLEHDTFDVHIFIIFFVVFSANFVNT